ncbi:phage virion morphogenesis protein [Psychroflexus sp. ALD_RP9]|uniref:phage virion morphogenesis protein n=1 Tax=Psychroflexus sp. ALD_RP9 TaxID=2777186 RepID=UPI001A8E5F09|nr:phage virion morphogenesis protein [Psychroflexus sp. ALD_RP9]QSS96598.1 phage virion morphogenesis protein [Psychroflexus sp. ALD_RP9]
MNNVNFQGKKEFYHKLNKLATPQFKKLLVDEAGIRALRFSKNTFRKKRFIDKVAEPWEKRKRKARGSTLVQSGRLKRSIRIIRKGRFYVKIGTDVPYAQIHNEGGKINKTVTVKQHKRKNRSSTRRRATGVSTVRSHTRKMNTNIPQRQFLGPSKFLARSIEMGMKKRLDKHLK